MDKLEENEHLMDEIVVIGGGLAGSEAALQIASKNIKVKLYEMKPIRYSAAHTNENLGEIVCSNSFKSNLITNACGLLKEELRGLGSFLIPIADSVAVPSGQALAVDRERFSEEVTRKIVESEYIELIREEVTEIPDDRIVIIATGPLTSDLLSLKLQELTGEDKLHFYDAASPIIEKESIDMDIAFYGNRYEQERALDEEIDDWKNRVSNIDKSYINLPMNKEEYYHFVNELNNAEVATLHDFEKREIFEGCMPIEIMAGRGMDTLRFGPLKPVGFTDPRTGRRPYAVVQLRQDNSEGNLYNMVGFQTNLKFSEQKRVFSLIPGLGNASYVKYGVMHRNTFINSPKLLDNTYRLKGKMIFMAGQITGVEGYVESIASGFVAAQNAIKLYELYNSEKEAKKEVDKLYEESKVVYPKESIIGALTEYISTKRDDFQPMNANFGIVPELDVRIKDKKERYKKFAERSLDQLNIRKNYN